eukprot:4443469-Heterocapsa_arctica.AAC.1
MGGDRIASVPVGHGRRVARRQSFGARCLRLQPGAFHADQQERVAHRDFSRGPEGRGWRRSR